MADAYFERTGPDSFRATPHVSGAWNTEEQHIAPALGLLAHVVETDRDARRDDGLIVGRLSYDILGTVPVGDMGAAVRVIRPGRTIELVEAALSYQGRDVVLLRAWLLQPDDTAHLHARPLPTIPGPDDTPPWDASAVWPGGFIESAEVRRAQVEPGHAAFWVRSPVELVAGEPARPLARAARLFDIANGMTVREDPREVAFPNVDLTAHLYAEPQGEWVGFDTRVSFGPGGIGVTSSVLHDETGPIGTMSQVLTVRPLTPRA
ncbi:thioesterase family protein [Actinomycetota bacterium]